MVVPWNGWFISGKISLKWMIWGYPQFQETSIWQPVAKWHGIPRLRVKSLEPQSSSCNIRGSTNGSLPGNWKKKVVRFLTSNLPMATWGFLGFIGMFHRFPPEVAPRSATFPPDLQKGVHVPGVTSDPLLEKPGIGVELHLRHGRHGRRGIPQQWIWMVNGCSWIHVWLIYFWLIR